MKKSVLNQNGNHEIPASLNGTTINVNQQGMQYHMERLILTLREVNAILDGNVKEVTYLRNYKYFMDKKIITYDGDVRMPHNFINYFYGCQLNNLLAKYIMSNFSMYELSVLFFQNQAYNLLNPVLEAKRTAIKNINSDSKFTTEHKKRLRKLVWDMNQVWFGFVLNFIMVHSLFIDEISGKILIPEYGE